MRLQVDIEKKLRNFSLHVQFDMEEEILAILGESGCGKSMTLKCISGIETPDRGRIVLDGRILFDSEKKINLPPQKRRIGYMFQDYALFPNMTVRKNIMAGMGKNKEQAEEYIRRFHLDGLEEHYPHQLSGGQKQRTAMARMLAARPEMILLDEPFSALDTSLKRELEQEMQEILKQSKKPVILVSHDQGEAFRLCSKISCMEKGWLDRPENIREFFKNPKTIRAAKISGCENIAYAQRRDDGEVSVSDWGLKWHIPEESAEKIQPLKAVAIQADKFLTEGNDEMLCFPITKASVTEEIDGWRIRFQTGEKNSWLLWRVHGKKESSFIIPQKLYVKKSEISLLKE